MNGRAYEILSLTLRYWFILLTLLIFWQAFAMTLRALPAGPGEARDRRTGNIPFLLVLLSVSAHGLLAFRNPAGFDIQILMIGVLISAILLVQFYLVYFLFPDVEPAFLLIVNTLSVFGLIMLQRLSPVLALRQLEWFAIGNVLMLLFLTVIPRLHTLGGLRLPMMAASVLLLFAVYFLGEQVAGARRWITLGPFTVQPSEFVKLAFVLALAFSLKEKHSLKNQWPLFAFAATSILAVVLQRDLGSALHYFLLFLFLYYIATSDWRLSLGTLTAGCMGAVASYRIFPHVRVRVQAWRNPWADVGGGGYQVVQSLIAIGSGGLLGLGLGLGEPYVIPASRTDFIFAALSEEFGVLVGGLIIGFFLLLLLLGFSAALKASEPEDLLLGAGASISLALQAFIIVGGVIKLIPLTGITLPYVSYGGSSMLVSLSMAGIIQGIMVKNARKRSMPEVPDQNLDADSPDEEEVDEE